MEDPAAWTALGRLYGIDLPGRPDRDYLIEDEQVAEWLTELRESDHMP